MILIASNEAIEPSFAKVMVASHLGAHTLDTPLKFIHQEEFNQFSVHCILNVMDENIPGQKKGSLMTDCGLELYTNLYQTCVLQVMNLLYSSHGTGPYGSDVQYGCTCDMEGFSCEGKSDMICMLLLH